MSPQSERRTGGRRQGDPDLAKLIKVYEARTEAFDALTGVLADNTKQLDLIHVSLRARPTRAAVDYQRRKSAVAIVALLMVFAMGHDLHNEQCGPGAEVKPVIREFLTAPPETLTLERLRQIGSDEVSPWCSILFPIAAHDDSKTFPSWENFVGWVLYGSTGIGAFFWVRAGRREAEAAERRAADIERARYERPESRRTVIDHDHP